MSICHSLLHASEEGHKKHHKLDDLVSAMKSLTYLGTGSNDIFHIMDVAKFYKDHGELCVTDLTKGKKVQVKVSEFERDLVTKIRHKSGYDDDFYLKSFAPRENHQ
jgi:hypothetical protein